MVAAAVVRKAKVAQSVAASVAFILKPPAVKNLPECAVVWEPQMAQTPLSAAAVQPPAKAREARSQMLAADTPTRQVTAQQAVQRSRKTVRVTRPPMFAAAPPKGA